MKSEKIKSIRYVGKLRCYDISLSSKKKGFLANGIQVHNSDFCIEDAFTTFEDGIKFKKKYPEVATIAMKLEGQIRGLGQHAAAVVISSEDLRTGKRASLRLGKDKEVMVNWDKYDIEHAGLMKLDVLGLNALTVLNETRKAVKKNYGVDINYEKLSLDDQKCYEEFSAGNNVGCFQVGCLSADTFVGIKNPKRISEVVVGDAIESCGTDGGIVENRIKQIFCSREIVFLLDVAGIHIKATEEHKFLTKEGWKKLKDLRVGDVVLTADVGYTYCPCGCGTKKSNKNFYGDYYGWVSGHCGRNPSVKKKISESLSRTYREHPEMIDNWRNKMKVKERDPEFIRKRNENSSAAKRKEDYRKNASEKQKAVWRNSEYRVFHPAKIKAGCAHLKESMKGNSRGGGIGKQGYREDLGYHFRSTWEANYARVLRYLGLEFEYEVYVFYLSDGTSYRPDFRIVLLNKFVEIKGYRCEKWNVKFSLFQKEYPDIDIEVLECVQYCKLKEKYQDKVAWENTETAFKTVRSIVEWGEVEVFDLEMEDKKVPNYVANGLVVHNSLGLRKYCQELGIENFDLLVAASALFRPGTLRCLTGDTEITCWSGKKVRVDEIDKGRPVRSSALPVIGKYKYIKNRVKEVVRTGFKVVYELLDADGDSIKSTAEHRFYVKECAASTSRRNKGEKVWKGGVWKELKEIRPGDKILKINRKMSAAKRGVADRLSVAGESGRFCKDQIPWNKGKRLYPDYVYLPKKQKGAVGKRNLEAWKKSVFGDKSKWEKALAKMKATKKAFWADPANREKMSNVMLEYYAEHEHPNSKGINVSKPQRELFEAAKLLFLDAEIEYKFNYEDENGKLRFYHLDVAIPSIKLNLEFDGEYWHKNPGGREEPRDLILEDAGWRVLRFVQTDYKDFISRMLELCLDNSTKYCEVISIQPKGVHRTYDLVMENQHFPNYIAGDFVVHNSGMTAAFTRRKRGEEKWDFKHPLLEPITKDTYGIILYQEQVMRFMYELGGLPWKTADTVRKVISKSQGVEQFKKFKKLFADGCVARKTLDRKTAEELWDELANFGCLTGDTVIYRCSANQCAKREMTIREAFDYQSNCNFKLRKLKVLSMYDDGMVKYNTISKIVCTGVKSVFEICTATGKSIKASAEHRFLIGDGWKCVGDLVAGDTIAVSCLSLPKRTYTTSSMYTYEKQEQIAKLREKYGDECQDCRSTNNIEVHHYDGNHHNSGDGNTRLLRGKCHHSARYHEGKIFTRFTRGYPVYYDEITSVEYSGEEETYDIEMVEEPRNFVANGIISHNSYGFNLAHAVEYSLITYWDMFVKTHYPAEFMCASLTYGADAKKEELVEEAIRLGLEIRPPKVGISKSVEWIAREGRLYAPFIEIKGFGVKLAETCSKAKINQEGFFKAISKPKGISDGAMKVLQKVNAFEDVKIIEKDSEMMQSLFTFSLSCDPASKFSRLISKISTGALDIIPLKEVNFSKIYKDGLFHFGRMTEIKYGYRGKIDTMGKKIGASGLAGSLGGVYGNYKDNTDFCMLVFGSDVYKKKKEQVEHCGGDFMLAKCSHPWHTNSIHCDDVWFSNELLTGELHNLNLKLARKNKRFKNTAVVECRGCSLYQECSTPVASSMGIYDAMVVGEAPGREEDKQKKGFVGDSGELLWNELRNYNLSRRYFHITNIVKCFPSRTKTPTTKHIAVCSKWLEEEIEKVGPFIILAFGNTALKFFLGQDSGIMAKNATTEWVDKYDAWVCWCIHPASVLYHAENMQLFKGGIKNFADKFRLLGGL